jgi:hypothetical protein
MVSSKAAQTMDEWHLDRSRHSFYLVSHRPNNMVFTHLFGD